MKRRQYDTYGMSGEGFAGASSAGTGARGPFPGAAYSGKYMSLLICLLDPFHGFAYLQGGQSLEFTQGIF